MFPFVHQALAAADMSAFGKVVDPIIANIVNPIVELMFAIGLIVFVFGVIEMIINGDDAAARTKGRNHMLGGVIGMFIMMSAWGIIYLVASTVGTFR